MELTYSLDDFQLKVKLTGELDHHSAKKIIDGLGRILDLYLPNELILDLSTTTFMDSSGIAVLLGAYRRMTASETRRFTPSVFHKTPIKTKKQAALSGAVCFLVFRQNRTWCSAAGAVLPQAFHLSSLCTNTPPFFWKTPIIELLNFVESML